MYESQQQIADFLEYLSLDEIKKAIPKLIDSGLIIKGNHNKNPFDKTAWYTVSDPSIIQKSFTKEPIGTIDRVNSTIDGANPHHPQCQLAPCIYKEKEEQNKKQQQKKVAKAPVVVTSSTQEKREQDADEAATQYINSEITKGNRVNETRIRKQALKEGWKPNTESSSRHLTSFFQNKKTYTGANGMRFECYNSDNRISFLNLNYPSHQPLGLDIKSPTFRDDFEQLLKKLDLMWVIENVGKP